METAEPGLPDGQLVARARAGDAEAFEILVRRHYRTGYAVALGQLANGMDAEDVVQDAFIKALERLDDCRNPDRFSAWFLQIVRNRAHNYRDYRRVRETSDLDTVSAAGPDDTSRRAEQAELRHRLESALSELGDIPRQVVVMHDMEGWKHRDIAGELGISEGMSRQHLFQARKALRARLGRQILQEHLDG